MWFLSLFFSLPSIARTGVAVAAVVAAAYGYNELIDNPRIRREALVQYTHEVTLKAAQAQLHEVERQTNAGYAATKDFEDKLAVVEAQAEADRQKYEQEIADHEKLTANRNCGFTDDDIKWLSRRQAGQARR